MQRNKSITVIIPTFNRRDFIVDAVAVAKIVQPETDKLLEKLK